MSVLSPKEPLLCNFYICCFTERCLRQHSVVCGYIACKSNPLKGADHNKYCMHTSLGYILESSKLNKLTHLPLDKIAPILADDIFKWIFLDENHKISIEVSLKFVPMSPFYNRPAFVRYWRGAEKATNHYPNKHWPSSLRHVCGTRGRWVQNLIDMRSIIYKIDITNQLRPSVFEYLAVCQISIADYYK